MAHNWIDSQAGKLKIDTVSGVTIERHPFKYYSVASKTIKVTLNPDGTEGNVEFFVPRNILMVHPTTGEIMGHHCGFCEAVELEGIQSIKAKGPDGVESVSVEVQASDIPADFMADVTLSNEQVVKKIAYKWDGAKLKKKTKAEMDA